MRFGIFFKINEHDDDDDDDDDALGPETSSATESRGSLERD